MKIALGIGLALSLMLNAWCLVVQPINAAVNAQAAVLRDLQKSVADLRAEVATRPTPGLIPGG